MKKVLFYQAKGYEALNVCDDIDMNAAFRTIFPSMVKQIS